MNERVVEILVYIMTEMRGGGGGLGKLEILSKDLIEKGYTEREISSAFCWLFDRLDHNLEGPRYTFSPGSTYSHRVLHELEKMIITPQAYGHLIQLRELGLLTIAEMEQAIERAMMLGNNSVGLEDIKAIVATVMFHPESSLDSSYFLFDENHFIH